MATINIANYKIGANDQFFFDTNIWLLLFGTISNFEIKDQKIYSNFFKELLQRRVSIFISNLVISEFINVILRHDFNQHIFNNKLVNQKFKENFVGSSVYLKSVKSISNTLNVILELPNILVISDNFNSMNHQIILDNLKIVDYNDACIYQLSVFNKYKILTNDRDFQKINSVIDIITTKI